MKARAPQTSATNAVGVRGERVVIASLRRLTVHTLVDRSRSTNRDIIEALIVARIVDSRSQLATVRGLPNFKKFRS